MKKIVYKLFYLSVLIVACNKNTQIQPSIDKVNNNIIDAPIVSLETIGQKDLNIIMYVNSLEGLRVRKLPSISEEKIGTLDYLTEVKIIKEDDNIVNINGIDGKWVHIIAPIEGWVFNGYLENMVQHKNRINEYIRDRIVGDWFVEKESFENNDSSTIYIFAFEKDGKFFYGPYPSGFGFFGKWKVNNEIIEIEGRVNNDSSSIEDEEHTVYLRDIKYLDNNNVSLYNGIDNVFEKLKRKIDN